MVDKRAMKSSLAPAENPAKGGGAGLIAGLSADPASFITHIQREGSVKQRLRQPSANRGSHVINTG
jgi:hypothetical protein